MRTVLPLVLKTRENRILGFCLCCPLVKMSCSGSLLDNDSSEAITEDEAALYDRQIRLWGLDAQKRLRASRILLVGISGLGAEICKNLVLSGVKSVTIVDPTPLSQEDLLSQFLVPWQALGKNRAESSLERTQQLNPMVSVTADTADIATKPDSFFTQFDVVVATGCKAESLIRINDLCNSHSVKFFSADVFGFYGYMFADLGEHKYVEEKPKMVKNVENKVPDNNRDDTEPEKKRARLDAEETTMIQKFTEFSRLKNSLSSRTLDGRSPKQLKKLPMVYFLLQVLLRFKDKHGRSPQARTATVDAAELLKLRDAVLGELKVDQQLVPDNFAGHCIAEMSPVCAIVGGIVGQEVVKAVSGKDAPINNFFFYDGVDGSGVVENFK